MKQRKLIPVYTPFIDEDEVKAVVKCVRSGWISSTGSAVSQFAQKFADYIGTKYAISTSSGTTALHLALLACEIKTGDEVLVPALTFAATANTIIYTGAKPVFVDIDPLTLALSPEKAEEKITKKTKAILIVHLYGMPAILDPLIKLAKKYKLLLIEDACEALGAEYKRKKVGSFGSVGCFSFYGNKIITTGEGGMLVTNSKKIAKRALFLRDHAMKKVPYYWHTEVGYNYRLTALQASVGLAQLAKIKQIISKKTNIANRYSEAFSKIEKIDILTEPKDCRSVWWLNTIFLPNRKIRNMLAIFLKSKKIETRPVFPILPIQPPYKDGGNYPVAFNFSNRGLNLPSGPLLGKDDINHVIFTIEDFFKKSRK